MERLKQQQQQQTQQPQAQQQQSGETGKQELPPTNNNNNKETKPKLQENGTGQGECTAAAAHCASYSLPVCAGRRGELNLPSVVCMVHCLKQIHGGIVDSLSFWGFMVV